MDTWAWCRTSKDFILLREFGRPRPPESGVAPLASASNPLATLVGVTAKIPSYGPNSRVGGALQPG